MNRYVAVLVAAALLHCEFWCSARARKCHKIERCVKIGSDACDAIAVPKNMCSVGRIVDLLPVVGRQIFGIRTMQCQQRKNCLVRFPERQSGEDIPTNNGNSNDEKPSPHLCKLPAVFEAKMISFLSDPAFVMLLVGNKKMSHCSTPTESWSV